MVYQWKSIYRNWRNRKSTIYVKIDGNRRITIGKKDDMDVKVEYTDLLTEQKSKK
ncbi:MAG: hypothetical protein WKG06_20360 [Segetibacter sp.]